MSQVLEFDRVAIVPREEGMRLLALHDFCEGAVVSMLMDSGDSQGDMHKNSWWRVIAVLQGIKKMPREVAYAAISLSSLGDWNAVQDYLKEFQACEKSEPSR